VDGHPMRSEPVTLVLPFLNISIHSYTLCRGNALSPYWAHKTCAFQPLLLIKNDPRPSVLLWCKLKVVQPCSLLHCSLLTASKVMSGSVLTHHLTGFNAAICHKAILYLLQTGMNVQIVSESP
jgi:hypothetical protein